MADSWCFDFIRHFCIGYSINWTLPQHFVRGMVVTFIGYFIGHLAIIIRNFRYRKYDEPNITAFAIKITDIIHRKIFPAYVGFIGAFIFSFAYETAEGLNYWKYGQKGYFGIGDLVVETLGAYLTFKFITYIYRNYRIWNL